MTGANEPLTAWTRERRALTDDQAAELNRWDIRAWPDGAGRWWVEPDSRVGVIAGDGWDIRINPRLKIPRLGFLLAYAFRREGWKDLLTGFAEADDVIAALASGFALHAERALHRGVLRGYVHVEESRQSLRGRVRFAEQLARSRGLPLPLEVAYDDFTTDILENRMIRTATEVLLRLPRLPIQARRRLVPIRALLEDVGFVSDPRSVAIPSITRLNERYAPALILAKLVLRSTSLAPERGAVSSSAFLFDMNKVFEDFVTAALEEALRKHGGWLRSQYNTRLDREDDRSRAALPLFPDITWWRGKHPRAVVDAKYKSLWERSAMPNADAYQMLAYCIALGIPHGFLVYAKESTKGPADYAIRRHEYVVSVRAFNVELEPDALLAEVDAFTDEIVRSSSPLRSAA